MSIHSVTPVNQEIPFEFDEIIVSKTDMKGKITYANDIFCRLAERSTQEVIGQPHNIIRHPDMPRAIFKLLWDTLGSGKEIFAYIKNMSKTGKYYWVYAHVTPSFDEHGNVNGYHSNRRKPDSRKVDTISSMYQKLNQEEQKHANAKTGLEASTALLHKLVGEENMTYSKFIWSIE